MIIINTGDGKGKTTAALGTVLRAYGYGWNVYILQFIKGSWHYGEMDGIKTLEPEVEMEQLGKGFYKIIDDNLPEEVHKEAAEFALKRAEEKMHSGKYKLVVLDEIIYALDLKLIKLEDVLKILNNKPKDLHIILTGRNANPELIEIADMVTEMKEVKHPFQNGIKARKGIDF